MDRRWHGGGWAIFPVRDAAVHHPHLPGQGWRGGPRHAGHPGGCMGSWGEGSPRSKVQPGRFAAHRPQGRIQPPPSRTVSARSVRSQRTRGAAAATQVRRRLRAGCGFAGARHRGGMHGRLRRRGHRGDPPRAPPRTGAPGTPHPLGSRRASSCPSVCPGIGYPLFPAGSLNRALATKTPPPLYLGAEGRRGEAHGGGRSGGSTAVSAGEGDTGPAAFWTGMLLAPPNLQLPAPGSASSGCP